MEVKNIQTEAFCKWLKENQSLHDAILFEFEFLNKQNKGDVPFSVNALRLGLKIPVDLSIDKYDTVWVVLRGVFFANVKIQYFIGAQHFLNAIYLTNAEVEVCGIPVVDNTNAFRLKLYADHFSEHEREWNEGLIVDVICESFEMCRQG